MSLFIGSILILESPPDLKLKVTSLCFLQNFCLLLCLNVPVSVLFRFWMRVMSWYMPDEQRNPIQEYQVSISENTLFDKKLLCYIRTSKEKDKKFND